LSPIRNCGCAERVDDAGIFTGTGESQYKHVCGAFLALQRQVHTVDRGSLERITGFAIEQRDGCLELNSAGFPGGQISCQIPELRMPRSTQMLKWFWLRIFAAAVGLQQSL
jgi:hypothetical protein